MNPGPVSRCLVRRVLHSLLETSISQLDRIGEELNKSVAFSQQNIGKQQESESIQGKVFLIFESTPVLYNNMWISVCTCEYYICILVYPVSD